MATRTLNVAITGDTRSLNRALSSSEGKLGKFGKVAGVAGAAAGGALVAGLTKAVGAAADFEQQLDRLGAVSDASAEQMRQLKKQALDAGAATKFSALEAAAAQTELAKGGLALKDILGGGLNSALGLAAAGEMELAEAAETTVNAMKLFNIRGRDAGHVADALAKAANSTTADVSDFAMALKQGGSAAKAAGYDLDQTVVALELLAENGIKGSDAGTSLKAMFAQLAAPTEKQLGLMDRLNIGFFDSQGNMKSVAGISEMLRDRMKGMTKEQELQTVKMLAGTDGMRAMLAMYGAGPEKIDKLSRGLREQGTAADVAAKKQDNLKGKWENFMGSVETLSIQVGSKAIPVLTDIAEAATDFLNSLSGPGVGRFTDRLRRAFTGGNEDATEFGQSIKRTVDRVVGLVKDLATDIRRALRSVDWEAIGKRAAEFARAVGTMVDEVTKELIPDLKRNIRSIVGAVRSMVKAVDGILKGDWKQAWEGARDTVKATVFGGGGIIEVLKGGTNPVERVGRAIGRGFVKGIKKAWANLSEEVREAASKAIIKGIRGVPGIVADATKSAIDSIVPGGDGLGKRLGEGLGFMGGSAGASGAGLRGADFDLAPFARIGASAGLSVTSGIRPGSITSTGNQSYHATGDAIDMAGSMGGMRRAATVIRNLFGSRIRELISPFPELGIKDGRPFRYSAGIQAQHSGSNAHVHVAYTGPFGDGIGRSGPMGDGLGRFNSTAYGPPWGGINGTGVTATGVNLKGAPRRYGVAVDPDVIPLGTRLKISPNPFGYGGYFTAFDTGGAIQGNRIDFYDWRGRASQMRWGTRSVTVSTADGGGSSGGGRSGAGAGARSRFGAAQRRGSQRERAARERARGRARYTPTGPQSSFGFGGGGGWNPVEPVPWWEQEIAGSDALAAALEANTRAVEDHKAAVRDLEAQMQRQTDLASSAMTSSSAQAWKALADMLSGQIAGFAINRNFTAGAGFEVAY